MSALGMPIQFLNGTTDDITQQYYDVLSGVDFDGNLDGVEDEDRAIKRHLIKTRNVIAARPHLVRNQNPATAVKMIDYALKYWDTPQRDKAIEILAQKERTLIGLGAISYDFEDGEEIMGLFGFLGSRKKRRQERRKKRREKIRNFGNQLKSGIKRFNPLFVTIRGGILAAFKMNMGQFATKSYPAVMPSGFAPDVVNKSKEAYAKIKKLFVNQLGGKEKNLQKAIKSGYKRKWTKKIPQTEADFKAELDANKEAVKQAEQEDAVSGLGAAVAAGTAAAAATAAPFLVKIAQIFSKGAVVADKAIQAKKQVDEAKKSIQDVRKAFKNPSTEQQSQEQQPQQQVAPPSQSASQEEVKETTETKNINNKPMNDTNPTFKAKLKKYAPVIIGATALGTAVYFFTRKKKTTRRGVSGLDGLDGLDGTRKRRTTARKTTTRKRTTTTARKKLASGRSSNARRVRTR